MVSRALVNVGAFRESSWLQGLWITCAWTMRVLVWAMACFVCTMIDWRVGNSSSLSSKATKNSSGAGGGEVNWGKARVSLLGVGEGIGGMWSRALVSVEATGMVTVPLEDQVKFGGDVGLLLTDLGAKVGALIAPSLGAGRVALTTED